MAVSVVAKNAITTPIDPTIAKNATLQTPNPTVAKFAIVQFEGNRQIERIVEHYSLDMILSVGYRVHSPQGILFRVWANNVLKQYLLQGYAIHPSLQQVEYHLSKQIADQSEQLQELKQKVQKHEEQLDFFIRTSTPPAEMVFFAGQFFTARVAFENIIKTAKYRVIIIDGYVDANTLDILDARATGVTATIYTVGVGAGMQRLMTEHDRQTGTEHIDILKWRNESHDRWLIVDDRLYHCGHSLNATGNKISAISLMGTSPETILSEIQ